MSLLWKIQEKKLDLKFKWKISRNSSDFKKNFFVSVSDNEFTGIGEIAPNIRYNETEEILLKQFDNFQENNISNFNNIDDFEKKLNSLNLINSLRFGIESAYIHFLCNKKGINVSEFFNIKRANKVSTSFSVPIIEIEDIEEFIKPLTRFESLKIKVNEETAFEMVEKVASLTNQKLRIDGNEAWSNVDNLIKFINKIKSFNIEFIEQPMPSKFVDEYKYLKSQCPFDLIADESIEKDGDFNELKKQFTGINVKLMKAGGYINGLKLLNLARQNGLKTMLGCMIETSLGISSAMNIAYGIDFLDLDGFLIIKDDPYNILYEKNGFIYFDKDMVDNA